MEDTQKEVSVRRGKRPESMSEPGVAVPRADMRAEMREESSADRAKRRAAEIRGHLGGLDDGTDEFYVDLTCVPDGWTYEWKRLSLLGAEDPTYTVHLARMGWEPVPSSRHPEMMPSGWARGTIERKGLILMERPSEVVDEARRLQDRAARDQVRAKEAQLSGTPDGTMTRDHEKVRPAIKKSFEAMPVPKD
jgi:hypothetical protein